jgi:cytochrome P450
VFGLSDGEPMRRLRGLLRRFVSAAVSPFSLWKPLQVDLGSASPWGRFVRLRREIDALLDAEIAARRTAAAPDRADVLQLLLAVRDETGAPMGDAEIRDDS